MLTKAEKQASIDTTKMHESDSGSSAVQVAILTKRIERLNEHFKKNTKDNHSRRGLLGLIEKRRKHLSFLKRTDTSLYERTIKALGLRK